MIGDLRTVITGTGIGIPKNVVKNEVLGRIMDTWTSGSAHGAESSSGTTQIPDRVLRSWE